MNAPAAEPSEAIRLLFELERADNPRLYDDLIRFKKGTKRVNRLRTLAQEGLLAQHWTMGGTGPIAPSDRLGSPRDKSDAAITNEVFAAPISE
jgi:hypothetical protein